MKDRKTVDLFDALDDNTNVIKPKPINPTNQAIADYNEREGRQHQDGDVYCLHGKQCHHHLTKRDDT